MAAAETAPRVEHVGEHGLFGLRDTAPAAAGIAAALARVWRVQHDLTDLGMSEESWAKLFAQR